MQDGFHTLDQGLSEAVSLAVSRNFDHISTQRWPECILKLLRILL